MPRRGPSANNCLTRWMSWRSGLSAGLSFQQAVEYTAAETSAPVSRHFDRLARWMALGHSTEDSMRHLLETVPEESLALAIEGIELQRQVGGDLVSMLAGAPGLFASAWSSSVRCAP